MNVVNPCSFADTEIKIRQPVWQAADILSSYLSKSLYNRQMLCTQLLTFATLDTVSGRVF